MRDDFAVFILTHGRAEKVITYNTLRKCGYTGKIYLVIDDMDSQEDLYREKYENVIQFNKKLEAEKSDVMDNDDDMRIVLYARNCCHEKAKELGLTYFLELDDDYTTFLFRYVGWDSTAKKVKLLSKAVTDFDAVVEYMLEFLELSGAKTVAFAQGGDYIGGATSANNKLFMRKAMNSFFCKTDRPFKFLGRINEDVNAYTLLGSRGDLFLTVGQIMLTQMQTQANAGGLTDVYLKYGTYVKSFYTVMCMPSAVKISVMGDGHERVHHQISWDYCVPKIISGRYKRGEE